MKLDTNEIHFIPPETVHLERGYYAQMLAKVLDGCYGKDYPGTSLDVDSNLQAITDGVQKTAFWAVTSEELERELFGTSSMVDARPEFPSGFFEMGKSGSLGSKGAKLGYIRFYEEWVNQNPFLSDVKTLITTVRNCPERPGKEHPVRSGIGIRIIFLKYLDFEQWGIAPWLLMPDDDDGSYEVLDLLFQFRDKKSVIDYLQTEPIHLVGDTNQDLLAKFAKFNHGVTPSFINTAESESMDSAKGWKIIKPKEKLEKNPVKLVQSDTNNTDFEDLYSEIVDSGGAMASIYVPLAANTVKIQRKLEEDGWILTGFIPGQKSQNKNTPIQGMWSKLNTKRPLVEPDYLQNPDKFSPSWYYQFVQDRMSKLQHTI